MSRFVRNLIIGIDLGTTNSVVTTLENDGASARPMEIGGSVDDRRTQKKFLFRSAVNMVDGKVGPEADSDEFRSNSYFSLKRDFIEDAHKKINVANKGIITPYDFQRLLLEEMYDRVIKIYSETDEEIIIESVTITVPTDFKSAHRDEMLSLVKNTKWGVAKKLNLIDEPIAASMAKLHDNPDSKEGHWITYDLGGGTFDVSLLETFEVGDTKAHKVHINRGDLNLGGDLFDDVIWDLVYDSIEERDLIQRLEANPKFYSEFRTAFVDNCGEIKMMLDHNDEYEDVIRVRTINFGVEIASIAITRNDYWNKILIYINRTIGLTKEVIEYAEENKIKIAGINFVGGSTKDAKIRKYVQQELGLKKSFFIKPEQCVSIGGAIHAGINALGIEKIQTAIIDTVSSPIGLTLIDGKVLWILSEGDPLPIEKEIEVGGVSRGQTGVTFSFVEASKLYFSVEQLQGNFFISRECNVGGFRKTFDIPRFIIRVHIDENKMITMKIEQKGTNVIKDVKFGDIINQKEQKHTVSRKEHIIRESVSFVSNSLRQKFKGNNPKMYLQITIEEIIQAQKARPDLFAVNTLKSIREGAQDAIDSGNEDDMRLWLYRANSLL